MIRKVKAGSKTTSKFACRTAPIQLADKNNEKRRERSLHSWRFLLIRASGKRRCRQQKIQPHINSTARTRTIPPATQANVSEKGQGNAVTKLLQERNDETNNAANNCDRRQIKTLLSSTATHVVYALENNCEVVSKLLQILESIRPSNKKEGSVLRLIMTTGKMTVNNVQIFLGL